LSQADHRISSVSARGNGDSSEAAWLRRLMLLFATTALIAVGLIAWGLAEAEPNALALEAGKVGMQLAVVTVLGLALTYVLGRVDEARQERARRAEVEREERRRLNEYQLTVFRAALDAYHDVKAVRRRLRARGFARRVAEPEHGERRLKDFDEQMLALNEAELELERVEREIAAMQAVFANAWKSRGRLTTVTRFLREVLDAWETDALLATEPDERQRRSLDRLDDFVAKGSEKRAEDLFSAIRDFESALRNDLLAPLPNDRKSEIEAWGPSRDET
jgi:hypothetical protein